MYTGDTDVFGDMDLIREMHQPDVAIMPIGGHYTMGPVGAARAAKLLGVSGSYPRSLRRVSDRGPERLMSCVPSSAELAPATSR